jgi:hypothetical protein
MALNRAQLRPRARRLRPSWHYANIGQGAVASGALRGLFLAYAISNNVGFAISPGIRSIPVLYALGRTAEELSRIVFSYSVDASELVIEWRCGGAATLR